MSERRRRIAAAFGAAADRYDAAATVQARAATLLAANLGRERLPAAPRVLEVGCGTGLFSRLLVEAVPEGRFLLTDIAPQMVEACRARVKHPGADFRVLDGEAPELPPGRFDLLASSFAFQWFEDMGAALAGLATLLRPGGVMWFATLGAGTFAEWRAAHQGLGLSCGTPAYPRPDAFPWPDGGDGRLEVHEMVEHPESARAFLAGLKAIGAEVAAPGHRPLGAGALRRVMRRFERSDRVTWQVLLGRFEKGA